MDLVGVWKQEKRGRKGEVVNAGSGAQQLENVLGQARRSTQAQAAQVGPSVSATQQAAPTPTNAPRAYTIRSGDTLSAISKRFYGTPTRWIDIYQANRDRLSSESAIRVGQEIRIP